MFMECPDAGKEKHVSALVLGSLLPIQRTKKRKPTLDDLAELIRQTHAPVVAFGSAARFAASVAIEAAVTCGGYLREAKAARDASGRLLLPYGEFLPWVRRETGTEPRTASNYMRLHVWVCSHQSEILAAKPHSLRQFYVLAGVLPEDESKKMPKENNDELAKLRRLVRRTAAEAAAHRGYAEAKKLWQALEPLAVLLREVSTDTSLAKEKHNADLEFEDGGWSTY
jgi:hypothetical protein